uniref:Uncharacterized protein MANES_02G145500 n=1 Tax=Rhizophora mucronata TaxID=61149 RepID=A0A2P2ML78_RHIMU
MQQIASRSHKACSCDTCKQWPTYCDAWKQQLNLRPFEISRLLDVLQVIDRWNQPGKCLSDRRTNNMTNRLN